MRQGPDPRPMIKGWLSQIVARLREAAPEAIRGISFPIGVEVDSGGDNSGWVLLLSDNKVNSRSKEKDEAKVVFYLGQNYLRALSIHLRSKYWKEAFAAGNVTVRIEDAAQGRSLQALAQAIEKTEAQ